MLTKLDCSQKKDGRVQIRCGPPFWAAALAASALLLWPSGIWGQEAQTTPGQSTIRSSVSLVSSPVVVRDAKGKLVMGLSEKDFRIFDNGVEQNPDSFELSGAPLSVALVVEKSSRIEPLLPALRRMGIMLTQNVLGESGEAAVIGYDDEVINLLDFSKSNDAIEKTFTDLQPGSSGATLYDAMSEAVNMLRSLPTSDRRVIITLAEAFDKGSERSLSQVLREAQLAHIMIYSVGLSTMAAQVRAPESQAAAPRATPQGTYGLPPVPGSAYSPTSEQLRSGNMNLGGLVRPVVATAAWQPPIEAAANATGGIYRSTVGESSMETAIRQIAGELTTQYTLTYRRSGDNTPGYHKIKIEIVGQRGLKARYRAGYYLVQP